MKIEQEIYIKEEGFRPEKCTAELESPVSSEFVSVRINGQRHEYYNLRKTSLNKIVDIMLLRTTSEEVLDELKEIVKRLEKDTQDKTNKASVMKSEENSNRCTEPYCECALRNEKGECKDPYSRDEYCIDTTETPLFGNNDNFAQAITDAGIKAAKATHEFNMKEIKAKLIADLCNELVKTPILYKDVPQRAREIADRALENL